MFSSQSLAIDTRILGQVSYNNPHGDTLLHWAIRKHVTSLVHKLLQNGVLTNLPNDEGQTPLHLAISSKNLVTCKLLVAAGASLHMKDKYDCSPVDLAMDMLLNGQSTDDSIIDCLVQQGSASSEYQAEWFRAFYFAILNCKDILTDVFLQHGWNLLDTDPTTGGTALHTVIASTESLAPLKRLVKAGVDINAVDRKGVTPLHIAAQRRRTDSVKYLIQHGASVDAIDHGLGGTPLAGTIFGAKVNNARAMIEAGANVFHKLKSGRPLLHLAAQQGQQKILELFLLAGVPVNTLDELGETAAYWACQNGHLECIEFLITHGLNLQEGKTNIMEEAIRQGHIPIVESLCKNGIPITEACLYLLHGPEDINPSRWEMMYLILRHLRSRQAGESDAKNEGSYTRFTTEGYLSFGSLTLAAASLETGHEVGYLDNKSCARLLFICAQHGFLTGTRTLLDIAPSLDEVRKYTVKPQGWGALEVAACEDGIELIKLFLERGWDPNREDTLGRTSLHLAALCGASDVVKELLHECNVHHRDKMRNTPIHLGAYGGSVQVLELLTTGEGDLNKQNKAGETPLGIACEQGHTEAARWLLEQGSQYQMGDALHLHPLHHSAHHNHVECMDLLITSGCNVNVKCAGENTPLHTAAKSGAWKAISRLLQADADPNCSDHQGMTPLALALMHADQSLDTITELLQKTSVDWDTTLSQNIIFTSCIGGNKHAITAVFTRLKQERPKRATKIVRRILPELLGDICSSKSPNSAAFPFLLEYMHPSSKEVLSTTILVKTIRAGDDAELAQALVDIDPKNAYLRMPGLLTMLHVACRFGRVKIARVLLANGAPAWAENEEGLSPLGTAKKYLEGEELGNRIRDNL
ncbi:hypothetical protein FNYG_11994 [Fusarium nygamai]|uniref:Uncharacterized protein n=1 Tax=Gibberella nygamai TaxID=42673 RepID=A0A2K0VXA6_GIBNY|nr:hypothetical protein FNYG_11994 [Fusarium nygamai]